jgi:hypothetical protein
MTDDVLVTQQRLEKGNIRTVPRAAHAGGTVASMGQVDTWHTYLDFVYDMDLLGDRDHEGRWRRDAGHDLLKLYTRTHRSDRSNVLSVVRGGEAGEGPVSEADVGTDADKYHTEWLKASGYLVAHKQFINLYVLDITNVPPYPMSLDGINELPMEESLRRVNRWLMQRSVLDTHIKAFKFPNIRRGVWGACDAIPRAMKRAHEEVWGVS